MGSKEARNYAKFLVKTDDRVCTFAIEIFKKVEDEKVICK